MKKFIVLSFAFMSLAFYIMSGGSDFVPASRMAASADNTGSTGLTGALVDPAKANEVSRAETDLTFASLNLPERAAAPVLADPVVAEPAAGPVVADPVVAPEVVTAPAAEPAGTDLRVVLGNLVNMRDGPGTDYGVVTKVTGGTLAEVIEVDATGWARIRLVDTDQTGWMAERLLAGG